MNCPCCDEPMVQRIFEPRFKMQLMKRMEAPMHFLYCRACEMSIPCNKHGTVPLLVPRFPGIIEEPRVSFAASLAAPEKNRGTDALGNCLRCRKPIDSNTAGYCPYCDGGVP